MKSFCGYFNLGTCRSCSLIELSYQEQVQEKEQRLLAALKDFGSFSHLSTYSSKSVEFRNKAKLSVTGTVEDPVIGLMGESELDSGREILACPLHHPEINSILTEMPQFIREVKLQPYQVKTKTGELKGLILFHSESSHETSLRFVLRSRESYDRIKKIMPSLQAKFPGLVCISINLQPIAHAILEGPTEIMLTERTYIRHQLNGIGVNYHPQAFAQTNQEVAMALYSTAAAWIKELNCTKFCEIFCGQGAFSFFSAPFIKQGLGIEINPEAVIQANNTAKEFKLSHLNFKCADANQVEKELLTFAPDVVLVNPPRKGLGKSVEYLINGTYEHIIYSSCSLESLTADMEKLQTRYTIVKAQIFDMFPHTKHFETLTLLKRK